MENQANSKSFMVNNGVFLGITSVLVSVIVYATGNHLTQHWSISLISIALVIGFVLYGIKQFKQANGGFMSWGQGVKIGVGIAVLAGLIGAIYQYVFMTIIEPDFMTQMMEIQNQKFSDGGMTEEQIEAANEMGKSFRSPLMIMAVSIIGSAILGFIISAITSAIMKKTEEEQY